MPEAKPLGTPLIIWTLQRTGGTNFTQRLVERSGLPTVEHEPFNVGRIFGAVTSAWIETRDQTRLRSQIREICGRRSTIKHCVELVPFELSRILLEESSKAGFAHLFLYRKRSVDRLLSLHFARQSGIWGPGNKAKAVPGEKVFAAPLPVAQLIRHEKSCAELLNKLWALSVESGQHPLALAFEDIYKVDPALTMARLLPALAQLGMSQGTSADQEFVRQLLAKGNQGTQEKYTGFEGVAELEQALLSTTAFRPAAELASLMATRMNAGHTLIARAVIDSVPAAFTRGQLVEIGGVVVLSQAVPGGCSLVTTISGYASSVSWSIASPKMKLQFPGSPNSAKSRFHFRAAFHGDGLKLVLRRNVSGQPDIELFALTLQPATAQKMFDRISSIRKAGDLTADDYEALRHALDAMPSDESAAWLKASITLDGVRQMNAKVVFAQLQALRAVSLRDDAEADFNGFFDHFQKLIHPSSIGPHGYMKSLGGRDQARIWADIGKLIETVTSLGLQCFINSGTLLGAIRDGELIAHDDDVDLAVVLKADSASVAAVEWQGLKVKLRELGLLDQKFDEKVPTHAKIGRAGGANVDLFPAWIANDRVHVWPHTCGDLPVEALLPLTRMTIEGVEINIPREAEKLLACNYGPGWKIRDPGFRFDWQRARQRFDEFASLVSKRGV